MGKKDCPKGRQTASFETQLIPTKRFKTDTEINARAANGLDSADNKTRDERKKSQRGAVLDGPTIAPERELHPELKNHARHQVSQARTAPSYSCSASGRLQERFDMASITNLYFVHCQHT
jgi:hypothetical protein